jgi:cell cycle arrest protein BUB2
MILLHVSPLGTQSYVDLVHQGASPAYNKIRNDTFRTLATDPLFRRRVTENSLARVLNAVAWRLHDAHEARVGGWQSPPTMGPPTPLDGNSLLGSVTASPGRDAASLASLDAASRAEGDDSSVAAAAQPELRPLDSSNARPQASAGGVEASPRAPVAAESRDPTTRTRVSTGSATHPSGGPVSTAQVGYVQGMNVLAAPFLYAARSEAEAFAAFAALVTRELPGYVRGSMDGVHRGLALVDEILGQTDPKLAAHLAQKGLRAEIYAFAPVLTLCACTPPLPEVLHLWDFLFAWGAHMNIVCVVAQLILIRDQILASPR